MLFPCGKCIFPNRNMGVRVTPNAPTLVGRSPAVVLPNQQQLPCITPVGPPMATLPNRLNVRHQPNVPCTWAASKVASPMARLPVQTHVGNSGLLDERAKVVYAKKAHFTPQVLTRNEINNMSYRASKKHLRQVGLGAGRNTDDNRKRLMDYYYNKYKGR